MRINSIQRSCKPFLFLHTHKKKKKKNLQLHQATSLLTQNFSHSHANNPHMFKRVIVVSCYTLHTTI